MDNPNHELFRSLAKGIPDLNMEYAIGNIGGSLDLYEQILLKVVRMFGASISEMDAALEAEDLYIFGIKAHGMKGSFNQVGCFRVAKLAEALEKAAKQGDAAYCAGHYAFFKAEASEFYAHASAALKDAGMYRDGGGKDKPVGEISGFADTLLQAKAAAEDFDARTAAGSLSALAEYSFGPDIDALISSSIEELEAYRPKKALPFINELLNKCAGKEEII